MCNDDKFIIEIADNLREKSRCLLRDTGYALGVAMRANAMPMSKDWENSSLCIKPDFLAAYLAGRLDDERRSCISIMYGCRMLLPLPDLREDLVEKGLVDTGDRLTSLGRDVVDVLVEVGWQPKSE